MIIESKKSILAIGFIGIINLLVLYFLKYTSNHLTLNSLDISKTGNFISLFFTLLLILGCVLLFNKAKEKSSQHVKIIFFLSIVYFTALIILVFVNLIELEFIDGYLFGYPFKKIIPIFFFVINQILFLFVLFNIWFVFFGYNLLTYIYSAFAVLSTVLILVLFSFVYTFFVDEFDTEEVKTNFDYGIIMGAAVWSGNRPSPIFARRIDKGAELFLNNQIKMLQLTGGNAPGEVSEAKAAYNYLKSNYNISSENILIEEATSTTNEQIRYIKNNFSDSVNSESFLFISDQFHLKRITEMADFYDLNAKAISSEYKLNYQKSLYYRFRDSIGLILFWFFAI